MFIEYSKEMEGRVPGTSPIDKLSGVGVYWEYANWFNTNSADENDRKERNDVWRVFS